MSISLCTGPGPGAHMHVPRLIATHCSKWVLSEIRNPPVVNLQQFHAECTLKNTQQFQISCSLPIAQLWLGIFRAGFSWCFCFLIPHVPCSLLTCYNLWYQINLKQEGQSQPAASFEARVISSLWSLLAWVRGQFVSPLGASSCALQGTARGKAEHKHKACSGGHSNCRDRDKHRPQAFTAGHLKRQVVFAYQAWFKRTWLGCLRVCLPLKKDWGRLSLGPTLLANRKEKVAWHKGRCMSEQKQGREQDFGADLPAVCCNSIPRTCWLPQEAGLTRKICFLWRVLVFVDLLRASRTICGAELSCLWQGGNIPLIFA